MSWFNIFKNSHEKCNEQINRLVDHINELQSNVETLHEIIESFKKEPIKTIPMQRVRKK